MSKKDYKLIADAIKSVTTRSPITRNVVQLTAVAIARKLKADNPAFQYGKFLDACGYPVE